ncbi:DUF7711 family protein, partial [Kineococcus glutinatus]|uniref:DUF7711 family protein n=1 Tax=Kineococcus glutinatus TaxID=1070872 RepID=UPI0031F0AA73
MKRSRAAGHVEHLARACADMAGRPATIFPLRVQQLWVAGALLEPAGDGHAELDAVDVALCVDVDPVEAAWRCAPHGAQHWASAVRLPQLPVRAHWRSLRAPVWNHVLHRPALVWDAAGGVRE